MTGHGKSLAEPAFPDDDGLIDPALDGLLGASDEVVAVIGSARVYVPVVAILGEQATDGSDKNAEMAAVLITSSSGRRALLTFTSVARLESWNARARPVPVYGRDAARAALAEGAEAMLLDLGSSHQQVFEVTDLQHLAEEHVLVRLPTGGTAWVAPQD